MVGLRRVGRDSLHARVRDTQALAQHAVDALTALGGGRGGTRGEGGVWRRCAVDSDCLGWALANGQMCEVWGGTPDAERGAPWVLPRLPQTDR